MKFLYSIGTAELCLCGFLTAHFFIYGNFKKQRIKKKILLACFCLKPVIGHYNNMDSCDTDFHVTSKRLSKLILLSTLMLQIGGMCISASLKCHIFFGRRLPRISLAWQGPFLYLFCLAALYYNACLLQNLIETMHRISFGRV